MVTCVLPCSAKTLPTTRKVPNSSTTAVSRPPQSIHTALLEVSPRCMALFFLHVCDCVWLCVGVCVLCLLVRVCVFLTGLSLHHRHCFNMVLLRRTTCPRKRWGFSDACLLYARLETEGLYHKKRVSQLRLTLSSSTSPEAFGHQLNLLRSSSSVPLCLVSYCASERDKAATNSQSLSICPGCRGMRRRKTGTDVDVKTNLSPCRPFRTTVARVLLIRNQTANSPTFRRRAPLRFASSCLRLGVHHGNVV